MASHLAGQALHPANVDAHAGPAVDGDGGLRCGRGAQARVSAERRINPDPISPKASDRQAHTFSPVNGSVCPELGAKPVEVEVGDGETALVLVPELLGPVGESEEDGDEPDEDGPEDDEPEEDEEEPEPEDDPCCEGVVMVRVVVVASGSVYCEPEAEPPPAASAPPAMPRARATTAIRQPNRVKARTIAPY
jgi:hypothetical protein